jgi:ABC-type phosphate transport system substrate-binding protein
MVLLLSLVASVALAADDFKVVVNAANPTLTLTPTQVSRMLLKQETQWANGQAVLPVDQLDRSVVRAAFSRAIHGREVAAVKSYWQRMIFSGTAVPPPEKGSDDDVLAFVRANPGAIGYVATATPLPGGVKTIKLQQ